MKILRLEFRYLNSHVSIEAYHGYHNHNSQSVLVMCFPLALDHLANADSIGPGLVMACIVCCRQSCDFLLHTVLCPAEYPNTVTITPNHIGIYFLTWEAIIR